MTFQLTNSLEPPRKGPALQQAGPRLTRFARGFLADYGLLVAFFADTGDTDSAARADNEAANIAADRRLEQCFSDTAARRRFFSLPAVAAVLPSA